MPRRITVKNNDLALEEFCVLIVDNDRRLVGLIKDILHTFGFHNIKIAYDGSTAIEMMQEEQVDIIILDWVMQPMDGMEFMRHVREDDNSPNPFVPVIMITGRAEAEDVQQARDAGVTEFLAKPFAVEDLRKRIISVIEAPRPFIISENFKGPDRRRKEGEPPDGVERRKPR